MPGLSYQKTISHCELLNMTLKPQLEELPHLKEESVGLDELIVELKGLDQEQQTLRGRLKEITRLRQEAELRGQQLRSRIAAQLRGKLGFKNENLMSFGILPLRRDNRRRTVTKPPVDPVDPPAES
jgi:hypothetical protein